MTNNVWKKYRCLKDNNTATNLKHNFLLFAREVTQMRVFAEGKKGRTQLWQALSKAAQPVLAANTMASLSELGPTKGYYGKKEEIGCSEKGPNL